LDLLFQKLQFLLLLTKHGILGVLINDWLVLDLLGSVGILEGLKGLLEVGLRWTYIGYHQGLGIPS
jgi:hypothetical protein